jgi:hypothetical protein
LALKSASPWICPFANTPTPKNLSVFNSTHASNRQMSLRKTNESSQNGARIHFGLKEIPPIVKGLSMTVQLVDDKLEALYFATPGLDSKAGILRIFTEKYGTPTTLIKASLQGADGAGYDTFTAIYLS